MPWASLLLRHPSFSAAPLLKRRGAWLQEQGQERLRMLTRPQKQTRFARSNNSLEVLLVSAAKVKGLLRHLLAGASAQAQALRGTSSALVLCLGHHVGVCLHSALPLAHKARGRRHCRGCYTWALRAAAFPLFSPCFQLPRHHSQALPLRAFTFAV